MMGERTRTTDDLARTYLQRLAASAATEALLADIMQDVRRTKQAPRLRWLPGGWTPTNALAVAAIPLVVTLVVLGSIAFRAGPSDPAGNASPSPSSTPTIGTIVSGGIEAPALPAGRWQTAAFEPTVRFTVPADLWAAGVDIPRQLWLRAYLPGAPESDFDAMTLLNIQNLYVDPCALGAARTEAWDPARGPAGFLDWLETAMASDLGPRTPVTMLGGSGLQVEYTQPDMAHCTGGFMPITDNGRSSPFGTPPAGVVMRFAILDLDGATILVGTWTSDPDRRDALWAAADAVLASLEIVP